MNLKLKNIVIVSSEFPPQPGGIGKHAYHLAMALQNEGFQITVVTDQQSDNGEAEVGFDKHLSFNVKRVHNRTLRFWMYIDRFIKVFHELKTADYVVASGKFSLWVVTFCTLFRKRFSLAVVHGTEVNLTSKVYKKLVELSLKRFDKVVAVSNFTKQLISHLNIDIYVIPNGIFLTDWQDNEASFKGNKLEGTPKLITVGRVSERKGQAEVVALLPELLEQYPELHYHCVGIDTESASIKEKAKSLGVEGHINFHGIVGHNVLKHYLKQSDIFIMLSKSSVDGDVEGFGIAILEANAMAIPAIGAFGSGVEDAIVEGQSGHLVPLGDAKAITDAIRRIIDNKQHYKQGAIRWAEAHDWNHIAKHYIALLP